jgi:hypothetical protein
MRCGSFTYVDKTATPSATFATDLAGGDRQLFRMKGPPMVHYRVIIPESTRLPHTVGRHPNAVICAAFKSESSFSQFSIERDIIFAFLAELILRLSEAAVEKHPCQGAMLCHWTATEVESSREQMPASRFQHMRIGFTT